MAAGTEAGKVLAFRVAMRTGVESQRTLCDTEGPITGLSFADKSEKQLIVTSADGKLRIIEFKSGKLTRTIDPNSGGLLSADVSPDGNTVAIATFRDGVHLVDLDSGETTRRLDANRPIYSVRFSPTGDLLIVGGDGGRILAWKLADGSAMYACQGMTGKVRDLHFSTDGLGLSALSDDGSVRFWNLSQPPRSATQGLR